MNSPAPHPCIFGWGVLLSLLWPGFLVLPLQAEAVTQRLPGTSHRTLYLLCAKWRDWMEFSRVPFGCILCLKPSQSAVGLCGLQGGWKQYPLGLRSTFHTPFSFLLAYAIFVTHKYWFIKLTVTIQCVHNNIPRFHLLGAYLVPS